MSYKKLYHTGFLTNLAHIHNGLTQKISNTSQVLKYSNNCQITTNVLSINLQSGKYNRVLILDFPTYYNNSLNYKFYFYMNNITQQNYWEWNCNVISNEFSLTYRGMVYINNDNIKEITQNYSIIQVTIQYKNISDISNIYHHPYTISTNIRPLTQLSAVQLNKVYLLPLRLPNN
ncbi:hypothetical protein [Candidatus Neoehrlichia procyonis]|nr:hypothetical protein [Candidatus Neoehrlichia lotoris]